MRRPSRSWVQAPILGGILWLSPPSGAMTAEQAIESVRANVDVLVRLLEDDPQLAPAPLPGERPVQLVIRTGPDGRSGRGQVLPLRGRTLDRDRERALRVGVRPEAWLVVVDPTSGVPVWWSPLGRPTAVHHEFELRDGPLSGTETNRREGVVAARVPFVPGGIVLRVRVNTPAETLVADEAMVFGDTLEDGIRVLRREREP